MGWLNNPPCAGSYDHLEKMNPRSGSQKGPFTTRSLIAPPPGTAIVEGGKLRGSGRSAALLEPSVDRSRAGCLALRVAGVFFSFLTNYELQT